MRVCDTSPEPVPREVGARRDRGLGIVAETLDRYDGCLEVVPRRRRMAEERVAAPVPRARWQEAAA